VFHVTTTLHVVDNDEGTAKAERVSDVEECIGPNQCRERLQCTIMSIRTAWN